MKLKFAIFGIVLIIAMFYYANVYLSTQEKVLIGSANTICNNINNSLFGIFDISSVRNCIRLTIEHDILSIRSYVYLIGLGLFTVGLVTGQKRSIPSVYVPNWATSPLPTPLPMPTRKFPQVVVICPICHSRSPENTKFCSECGSDIRPNQVVK